ncbi:MAG TPA: hypothetical protein VKX33_08415 [Cyclobacteriaceae bacterium]|nr:hypothetical protein [Cyclobacteriaceae bacterium]
MLGKGSPLFHLFESQFKEARSLSSGLGKNFKSKKAIELEEKLIFLNIYLQVLNKIYFKEERLKFEPFEPFKPICRSMKRIHHFKLATAAFEEVKGTQSFTAFEAFLTAEKKVLYKEAYEVLISSPIDIWESFYLTVYSHSKKVQPLMINTATTQLINEELEYISFKEADQLDSEALKDIMEALRVITVGENMKIAIGLNPSFTSVIHGEMKSLSQLLIQWHQIHLFAQYLNYFLSGNEDVSLKYLELAKKAKIKKQRLSVGADSLCKKLLSKLTD